MHIDEIKEKISSINQQMVDLAQKRFDQLIKPVGSLAKLELMVSRYAGIIGKHRKQDVNYPKCSLLVWGSFGEAQEIGQIMEGKRPVNILAATTDSGVDSLLVTADTLEEALSEGADLVQELIQSKGLGMVGFGSLAAADDELVIEAMAGGILQAAALKVPIMLDGLATCRAALRATELVPWVREYCFAGHLTLEEGAKEALEALDLSAPLKLNLATGVGEGAAVAFTLFRAGIKAYKEMETFEEAGVHAEVKDYSRKEEMQGAHWQQL